VSGGRRRKSPSKPSRATVVIRNKRGLHARASAKFVQCAERFNASVSVTREGMRVSGTSIMGLMMLAAAPGAELLVEVEGPEAKHALAALIALIESGFGEDESK
jgi:phosphocarrier protein